MLRGHVLQLITNGIFYGCLNIYKLLRLSPEQNIIKFQSLKSHLIHDFEQKKTFQMKNQSLSCQNIFSKLSATYEMNFWERKIHRVRESNLTFFDLTVKRLGATRTNPPTNVSAKIYV